MKIKVLKKNNISYTGDIARLHAENIRFKLSNLGIKFLTKIYRTFLLDKNIKIWILVNNQRIVGYLCGCINNKKIYKNFLLKNFFFLIFFFLKNILSLSFLKNFFGLIILILSSDKKNYLCNSELLSIVISKKFRNKFYGKKLIRRLDIYLKKKNKKEYIVKVESKLNKAINFYLSNKFKRMFKINYPLFNIVYLKKTL
tara:strand:+ start:172 stop:768 length:597 start_codon:yes stop_codon:yes gene_type:complete